MRKILPLVAAMSLPLAACATYSSPYGYGYDRYGSSSYGYNPIVGAIGALGGAYGGYGYGGGFSQAAVNACANYASRYGAVRVTSVRQTSSGNMHVYGLVSRGFGSDDFDCTFRTDGRVSDFDL